MAGRRALLAASLIVLAGCRRSPGSEELPLLFAVVPSVVDGRALDVELHGENFVPAVATDFTRASRSTLDGTFTATLMPSAGGDPIPLEAPEHVTPELLRARLPEGLAKGSYDLLLVDPAGRESRLVSALSVVTSAESVAGFRFEAVGLQRLGVPFTVLLTAVDQAGQTVDGFDGTVRLTDVGGSLSVSSAPFLLGRGQVEVTATIAGTWVLSAEDALGHSSDSEPFEVRGGLPLRARVLEAPGSADVGGCAGPLRFRFDDALGNPADVEAPVTVSLRSLPEGVPFFSDPACAEPATSLVASTPGELYFRPTTVGALQLHLLPEALVHATHSLTVTP